MLVERKTSDKGFLAVNEKAQGLVQCIRTATIQTEQGPPKKPLCGNLQGFEWNQCHGRKEDRRQPQDAGTLEGLPLC